MSKTRLKIEYDFDFCLIGIVCSEKDFRLCWMLNNQLGWNLAKMEDHTSGAGKHALFSFSDEDLMREYYLIANKADTGKLLLEEHQHTDYFIIIRGEMTDEEKKYFAEQIKKLNSVSASYIIDVEALKSKQNLIF
jgi:hypothetical protein